MPGLSATLLGAVLATLGPAGEDTRAPALAPSQSAQDPLERAGALWDEASARFEIPDYEGAVELYEEVYLLLVQSGATGLERELADLQRSLAQACVLAHELTGDIRYLQRARIIWGRLLSGERSESRAGSPLRVSESITHTTWREAQDAVERPDGDEQDSRGRSQIELELVYVEELLAAHAAELEAESARRRDIAEVARRQLVDDERIRDEAARAQQRRLALARARARRTRAELIAGGTLTGLGVLNFAVMGGGLARGASLERQGHQAREDPETSDARFDELIAAGGRANSLALATGVLAGLSSAVGLALLIHGSLQLDARARVELSGSGRGLQVQF